MKRQLAAAALVLAALALSGCGGSTSDPGTGSAPTPTQQGAPTEDPSGLNETKPIVDGTELICIRDDRYGSTTCNWELWNKTRETTK